MNDTIFERYYSLMESVANGHSLSEQETEFLDYAEERIQDWATDIESVF